MEKDLRQLEDELDLKDFTVPVKSMAINVFKSWKTCFNNQIIITDIKNKNKRTNIKIYNNILIDGIETFKDISTRSTILFSNCDNLNIIVLNKINHIVIENSNNINLKSTAGIIGGIDALHSKNINLIITNRDIFYMSFGEVSTSNTYIDKSLALNTLISTLDCNAINFVLTIDDILENVKYLTNISLFSGFNIMMFINNNLTNIMELHYINKENNNSRHNGIIYPK